MEISKIEPRKASGEKEEGNLIRQRGILNAGAAAGQ